ncbi:MAG: hypothetical protein KDJ78_18655, partial [Rhodobacteraceae bacterium]|nr:hypothetical protein [Paracoccaceae bacterium]
MPKIATPIGKATSAVYRALCLNVPVATRLPTLPSRLLGPFMFYHIWSALGARRAAMLKAEALVNR